MVSIVRAELIRLRLPLLHRFETSSHTKTTLDHILIKLTDSDGAVGWGECASPADPYFNEENVGTCWLVLREYLLPAVVGRDWVDPAQAYALGARVRGNRFAKAGLDIACWDLWTRREGVSVATAIGATQVCIEAGVSLGIERTVPDLLAQVGNFLAQGYRRIKLKIAPGWDLAPVAAVRQEFGDVPLQVDANCAYPDSTETLQVLCELDELGLLMIEQPYAADDLLAHARAQQALTTPICLDETITSEALARTAVHLNAARIVNVKVSRLGGVVPALAVHAFCRSAGVPLWCGGMHEFGVGRAANVAVAALPGFTLASDISGSDKYFADDIVEPPIRASAGLVAVPYDRAGLGHQVRVDESDDRIQDTAVIVPDARALRRTPTTPSAGAAIV